MNQYAEKYPNVFITQNLVDLVQYGLTDPGKENIGKKLKVISQVFDEADGLDSIQDPDGPIGLEADPFAGEDTTPPAITEADLPPEVLEYMKANGLTIDDLIDEGYDPFDTGQEPEYVGYHNLSQDNADDFEMSSNNDNWQQQLKNWFGNKE